MSRARLSAIAIGAYVVLVGIVMLLFQPPDPGQAPPPAAPEEGRFFDREVPVTDSSNPAPAAEEAVEESGGRERTLPPVRTPASVSHSEPVQPSPSPDRSTPDDRYTPFETDVDIVLLCYAWSGKSLLDRDYETLAGALSYEYRAEANPSARQKLFESLKQKIDAKLAAFRGSRYFSITRAYAFDRYDPGTKSFPLVMLPGSPVTWLSDGRLSYLVSTASYTLQIENADDFARYPLDDEAGVQAIEARPYLQGQGEGKAYLFVRGADAGSRVVRAGIVKVQLSDWQHKPLATLE